MAVGDVVSDISASNTVLSFQPAAGVEVMLTAMTTDASGGELTDGSDAAIAFLTSASAVVHGSRIFLTNTLFLSMFAVVADFTAFTAIQIK